MRLAVLPSGGLSHLVSASRREVFECPEHMHLRFVLCPGLSNGRGEGFQIVWFCWRVGTRCAAPQPDDSLLSLIFWLCWIRSSVIVGFLRLHRLPLCAPLAFRHSLGSLVEYLIWSTFPLKVVCLPLSSGRQELVDIAMGKELLRCLVNHLTFALVAFP